MKGFGAMSESQWVSVLTFLIVQCAKKCVVDPGQASLTGLDDDEASGECIPKPSEILQLASVQAQQPRI